MPPTHNKLFLIFIKEKDGSERWYNEKGKAFILHEAHPGSFGPLLRYPAGVITEHNRARNKSMHQKVKPPKQNKNKKDKRERKRQQKRQNYILRL